jgi:tetratricopeptide (TPR) repeat protein
MDHNPVCNLPYPPNPFFTGRERELEQLYAQLHQHQIAAIGQTVSISGLGGIGKTQLAVAYAYQHINEYHFILWARAESVEALTASYVEIAHLLDLPETDAQEQEIILDAVKRWLHRQRGWLLLLDNADIPAFLPTFLPRTFGGHLLITTRAADLSVSLASIPPSLPVTVFSEEQGTTFLLRRSGLLALAASLDQVPPALLLDAQAIVQEFGGLPLALDQAGAYLKETGCTLAAYWQMYRDHRADLLSRRRRTNASSHPDHPDSVATTWNISFEQVEQQIPAAADLLRLCAYLAPDAIPEELITQGGPVLAPSLAQLAVDAYQFNQAMETLHAYSLLTRDPITQTLTIHRLVQTVLRDTLSYEEHVHWIREASQAVEAVYPDPEVAHWIACERLLPHILVCVTWMEPIPEITVGAARLLNQAGRYLRERGRYQAAEPLYQRALAIREQHLGPEHPDTATSLHNLAALYQSQGKDEQAEPLLKRALAICEQHLGPEHPDTATCLNNLAHLYGSQGKDEQAEPLLKRALAICEQHLGPEHPTTQTVSAHFQSFLRLMKHQREML